MKKLLVFFIGFFTLLTFTVSAQAQNKDYFVGKWDISITGTPQGDGHATLQLERKDGKLVGTFAPPEQQVVKINRVEEDGDEITVYFTSNSGYDVYLYIAKVDENNVEGSMMDMFDATGKRIIEEQK